MLTRAEVSCHYRKRFSGVLGVDHPAYRWVDRLPPYLCRALILRTELKKATRSLPAAFVGSTKGEFIEVEGLQILTRGFSERLFSALPLDGHTPLEAPGLTEWIRAAIKVLVEINPDALRFVQDWCSVVLWVAPTQEKPPKTVLTSVAIPTLPHCTIISVKSLRHIPSRHVFEGASIYALAENLFHEALHQKLSASLIFEPSLMSGITSPTTPTIQIPWRKTKWAIDRVLHATWVYSNLQILRDRALALPLLLRPEMNFVREARDESKHKLEYLRSALRAEKKKLSKCSQQLLEEILL